MFPNFFSSLINISFFGGHLDGKLRTRYLGYDYQIEILFSIISRIYTNNHFALTVLG